MRSRRTYLSMYRNVWIYDLLTILRSVPMSASREQKRRLCASKEHTSSPVRSKQKKAITCLVCNESGFRINKDLLGHMKNKSNKQCSRLLVYCSCNVAFVSIPSARKHIAMMVDKSQHKLVRHISEVVTGDVSRSQIPMDNIVLTRLTSTQPSVVKVPEYSHGILSVKSNPIQSRTISSVTQVSVYKSGTWNLDQDDSENSITGSSISSDMEEIEETVDLQEENHILEYYEGGNEASDKNINTSDSVTISNLEASMFLLSLHNDIVERRRDIFFF